MLTVLRSRLVTQGDSRNGRSVKLPWLLPAGTTCTAPPPNPASLLPPLAAAAATTGVRAEGLLLLLLLVGRHALKTAAWRGPSHHILPGVFQSCGTKRQSVNQQILRLHTDSWYQVQVKQKRRLVSRHALKTAAWRGPSHHILPGVFQSCKTMHKGKHVTTSQ
jgi:hypothetical protein